MHAFGPTGDDAIQREGNRFSSLDRAVEHFAIGGPAGVVDFDRVGGFRIDGARAGLEHARGQAAGGLLCGGGHGGHIFWHLRGGLDGEQFNVEDEHPSRSAAHRIVTVGEFGWDPEATLFSFDHELHAFRPTGNDAVERETGWRATFVGAIEKFAIGRPTAVMHLHGIRSDGFFCSGAFFEHFGRETGCGGDYIGGRGIYISWGGEFGGHGFCGGWGGVLRVSEGESGNENQREQGRAVHEPNGSPVRQIVNRGFGRWSAYGLCRTEPWERRFPASIWAAGAYFPATMIRSPRQMFLWAALIASGGVAGYLTPTAKWMAWREMAAGNAGPSNPSTGAPDLAVHDPTALTAEWAENVQPLLENHCGDCHGGGMKKGGLDLDAFPDIESMIAARPKWKNIRTHIASNLMPPPDEDPIAVEDKQSLLSWIDRAVFPVDPKNPDPGVFTIRRLNRAEYAYTIRDLLGVEVDAGVLPEDDTGYGFDNIGDVLSLAPAHLERYQQLAEKALALALDPVVPLHRLPLEIGPERWSGDGRGDAAGHSLTMVGTAFTRLEIKESGQHELAIDLSADQAGSEKAAFEILIDGKPIAGGIIEAANGIRETWRGRVHFSVGRSQLGVRFPNDFWDPTAPPERRDRNLRIHRAVVEGPVDGPPPPFPHTRAAIWLARQPGESEMDHGLRVLASFLPRVFRRSLTEEEFARYRGLVEVVRSEGESVESAVRLAMEAALIAPDFLFRGVNLLRREVPAGTITRVDEFDLANRLSYFLWSSMPDQRLLELAGRGELSNSLVSETERMLADPRAAALVDRFFLQWLRVSDIAVVQPDEKLFRRAFNSEIRSAMMEETRDFCRHLLVENRPAIEMLTAEYTFANPALRRHYGLPVCGDDPSNRMVSLAGTGRRGVLTQGAVLTLTSHPTRTSPVKRGQWVLETILDQPPPPPPPNVPSLESLSHVAEDAPLRVKLEAHQADPACAACHKLMDGIGYSFEHFDAIGRWRDRDGPRPIDARGALATGESFTGVEELIALLAGQKRDEFHRALAAKMLTFALGRGLEYYDEPAVSGIVAAVEKEAGRMKSFVHAVVASYPFQHQRNPEKTSNPKESL